MDITDGLKAMRDIGHREGMLEAAELIRHLSPDGYQVLLETVKARALRMMVQEQEHAA